MRLAALAGATLLSSLGVSIATSGASNPCAGFFRTGHWASSGSSSPISSQPPSPSCWPGGSAIFSATAACWVPVSFCSRAPPSMRRRLRWAFSIAGRTVQGIGGAILMALPVSLIRETVRGSAPDRRWGCLARCRRSEPRSARPLGGMLVAGFGWRAAFVALAGAGIVGARPRRRALSRRHRPVPRRPDGRMDWPGAALLALT